MKRISLLAVLLFSFAGTAARSQDAATEERLNKLSGQIEDLVASYKAQQKHIAELSREIENAREQANKPSTTTYATQEEFKRLAEKLQEVDKNREHDKDLIL